MNGNAVIELNNQRLQSIFGAAHVRRGYEAAPQGLPHGQQAFVVAAEDVVVE